MLQSSIIILFELVFNMVLKADMTKKTQVFNMALEANVTKKVMCLNHSHSSFQVEYSASSMRISNGISSVEYKKSLYCIHILA